jgi:hypothetical protein
MAITAAKPGSIGAQVNPAAFAVIQSNGNAWGDAAAIGAANVKPEGQVGDNP